MSAASMDTFHNPCFAASPSVEIIGVPTAMLAGVSTAMLADVTRFAKLSVKGLGGRLVSEA